MKNSLETIRSMTAQAQGALANLGNDDAQTRVAAISMIRDVIGRINAVAGDALYSKKR